ncbi:MAG: c-type cytochrome biogenesis protein CcmI [Gammaproteobacteria bacterium]|nr:c-type cytochrome biogenesis protein CcmI [Gammaproteobacteria bacterium]
MNVSFWGAMLTLLLIAIVLVIFPLIKIRQGRSVIYKTSNIQLHEEKINELNIDLQEGRIDQAAYKIARQELDRELLEDTPVESKQAAAHHYKAEAKKHPALALAIAVFLPTLSMLVYTQLGMHASSQQEMAATEEKQPSIDDMVARLEQYLESNKGELKDWVMLARSYKYLGRYGEAANAYIAANAIELNPQVMLEHAEVLALINDKKINDEARDLIMKALAMEPDNLNTLWFAGVAEFQFGNYHQSIEHLSRLSEAATQDPKVDNSIRYYIAHAREQLIAAGEEVASMEELLPKSQVAVAEHMRLQIKIDITDEARQKFVSNDVVFVYAKALQGPKMPLAAQRITLADLPATIVLDDTMGMVEGMNLSAFDQVVVSARISKAGTAIAQSGDYIGQATVEDVSATEGVSITIDSLVP